MILGKISKYISITKPGIIVGNLITLSGGFFFAARGFIEINIYLAALIGMAFVIAGGCIFNNIIDRDIDQLMQRTKNRVLITSNISLNSALTYATVISVLGLAVLAFFTNLLSALIAFFGLTVYVIVYSLYAKRFSKIGIEIGAIAGAIPPVIGYCAITNAFDSGALSLFLALFFWQLPHSYAIAIYRLEDFQAASIPVLPLVKGIRTTKIFMLSFIFLFVSATFLPTLLGFLSYTYLIIEGCLGLVWIYSCFKGFNTKDNIKWARQMFLQSILLIVAYSVMISFDASFMH